MILQKNITLEKTALHLFMELNIVTTPNKTRYEMVNRF